MTMHDRNETTHGAQRPDDEPLDGWLQALADDYHRPPATPREQMWARIQAARADESAGVAGVAGVAAGASRGGGVAGDDDLARLRERGAAQPVASRWTRGMLALAATLLLGVALGRLTRGPGDAGVPAPSLPSLPSLPSGTVAQAPVIPAPTVPATPAVVHRGEPATPATPRQGMEGRSPVRTLAAAPRPEPVGPATTPERARSEAAERAAALAAPLHVAAVQHLGEVEFLLTSFRLDADVGEGGAALQPWARELLTTTRLMLDSPVGGDARLGPLLGDLEVVLAQIAQLPAARAAEERQLISRSLEHNDLMTQLRTAVPAGPARAQRSGE